MSKKCLNCGAELPDSAKFCDKCGTAVSEQEQPLYCQKCGAKLEPGTKFCGRCGTSTDSAAGQEFQQFADSAKAAAQAGMNSAKKGAAKGMAYAAERMAAAAEKMKQKGAESQTKSEDIQKNDVQDERDKTVNSIPKKKWLPLTGIAAVVVVIILAVSLLGNSPVADVQDIVFDQYGTISLGDAVAISMPEAKWSSEKIDSKHYTVTVEGFFPETAANVAVIFDVNYSGEWVYANPIRVTINGESFTDFDSIAIAMGLIY